MASAKASAQNSIIVHLWDPDWPQNTQGRRWHRAGVLLTQGIARGAFVYFDDYSGPPLDPLHLDYRTVPPGTVFKPEEGVTHRVFRDALPGAFGRSLLLAQFPDLAKADELTQLAWFGTRAHAGLLFEAPASATPERYIHGIRYLEAVREQSVRFALKQLRQVLNEHNTYSLTSMGGARPKAAVVADPDRSGTDRFWIAKFDLPIDPYKSLARVEHAMLRAAARAGITVPDSRVVRMQDSNEDVLLVERYDRTQFDRVHRLSFRSLTGLDNTDRRHPVSADFTDMIQALTAIGNGSPNEADVEEMARRALFQIWTNVSDNHLANFEMILKPQGTWALSPAYDLVPVPGDPPFATTICGFQRQTTSKALFTTLSRQFGLPLARVQSIGIEVLQSVMEIEQDFQRAGVSPKDRDLVAQAVPVNALRQLYSELQAERAGDRIPARNPGAAH